MRACDYNVEAVITAESDEPLSETHQPLCQSSEDQSSQRGAARGCPLQTRKSRRAAHKSDAANVIAPQLQRIGRLHCDESIGSGDVLFR
ncbi:hypothetical protein VZT92_001290 [Zoarces viviparus]|uniref:Uncharacterized protein n=1 Tax=Zoarces viviparus TaxID=48416 RepID=A0AAW1G2C1_ZOAVI